ncbi:acyl-CoA dehydrogenase [Ornithinimicrobium pratense]|uniref:Acyl-CoA dehydrogenase n=1 Tax=Ornithinimicrobium pratense TaxID=2593973 RepID=A0A5J6V918_9MICO|nr:acyl-CoA dehydrogenase [Ornithinimicrobium pratense]QFG69676.1 acyl-CoA dehydrogenase [Ornithinimicrobium pratense]
MGHYRSNVRDTEFMLFDVLRRQDVLGAAPYEEVDLETAREALRQVAELAEGPLAASFEESDRQPPVFDPATGQVSMPESFVTSYLTWVENEWWRLEVDESLGGTPAPPSLSWALSELVLGANPAVKMFSAGFTFANLLHRLGTPDQQKLAQLMIDQRWGATMVLTEPDAGSDVGAGRAKAVDAGDGSWHLTGVKRFITSGIAPFYDNVVHFVLARPEGALPGTKGLSLFLVSDHHIEDLETGELGERNGVEVANIEHKMGLKISTTCELRFGEDASRPAVGYLLGEVHDGIAQMFRIIEYARMLVGTKAIATLSTGYLNALDYAKERVQGADLAKMADKASPRVTITHHPDVRRSLMLQKAYAEGLRALMLYTASMQDVVHAAQDLDSSEDIKDPGELSEQVAMAARVNDLLLPLVKGCGSERAWTLLGTESLQTYGGSGFLQDYPIEQYVRDAKIDSLYEGTTAIQGMDFFFRKIVRDKGAALGYVAQQVMATVSGQQDDGLGAVREAVGRALAEVQQMVEFLTGRAMASQSEPGQIYAVGLGTTRLLMAAGDLMIGWLLLRQAEVAAGLLAAGEAGVSGAGEDPAYLQGKVAAAKFFATEVLPRLGADRRTVTAADVALMELPEDAF